MHVGFIQSAYLSSPMIIGGPVQKCLYYLFWFSN